MGRKGFYKRGWHHTKMRGRESVVICGFCGRKVPKYKTFSVVRSFRINDPLLRKEFGSQNRGGLSLLQKKIHACPGCARFHKIVRKKR